MDFLSISHAKLWMCYLRNEKEMSSLFVFRWFPSCRPGIAVYWWCSIYFHSFLPFHALAYSLISAERLCWYAVVCSFSSYCLTLFAYRTHSCLPLLLLLGGLNGFANTFHPALAQSRLIATEEGAQCSQRSKTPMNFCRNTLLGARDSAVTFHSAAAAREI